MKIIQEIDIQAAQSYVFDFISNFENNPKWQDGMKSCIILDQVPLSVGQEYQQIAYFLGKEIRSQFIVTSYIPGQMVKATTKESSFPITFTRRVSGDEHFCHVTAIVEGDSSGFFKIFSPLMKLMVTHSIKKDYKVLKELLEKKYTLE